MAVTKKTAVFWDVTPCSLILVYNNFGGKYCLNLQQEQRVSQTSKQRTEWLACFSSYLAYSLILNMKALHSSEM
jgi:hypothetical protein